MHLRHLIPWSELVPTLRVDPSEISLPVGDCGRIHINDKATEIKVEHRNFIRPEQICTDKDCNAVVAAKTFSKNKLSQPMIKIRLRRGPNDESKKKIKFFFEKFCNTVLEFAKTEENKYPDEVIDKFVPKGPPELVDMHCIECYGPCRYKCDNFIVFSLYTKNELNYLLWLNKQGKLSIQSALSRNYGGQAVGNGYQFLVIHHLLPFYVAANAIIACGYESCEEKWGILSKIDNSWGLMWNIEYDCDFLTFIPSLRPYLKKDVFMKDMTKTIELLREVFRHIYVYFFLKKKFGGIDDGWVRDEIKYTLQRCFGFSNLDYLLV